MYRLSVQFGCQSSISVTWRTIKLFYCAGKKLSGFDDITKSAVMSLNWELNHRTSDPSFLVSSPHDQSPKAGYLLRSFIGRRNLDKYSVLLTTALTTEYIYPTISVINGPYRRDPHSKSRKLVKPDVNSHQQMARNPINANIKAIKVLWQLKSMWTLKAFIKKNSYSALKD